MSSTESSPAVQKPAPPLFPPRERRILLWLCAGAICWRWVCAIQSPLPSVAACRDLWLVEHLAHGEFAQLADAVTQPWWALLLSPWVAAGCDAFATAQVLACVIGGLLVWPVAVAAERLREGAGLPAAVLALAAGGPAAAAGGGAATPLLAIAVAFSVVGIASRRWVLVAVSGTLALAPGVEAIVSGGAYRATPWHWHELRLGWGTSVALALWSVLPPRPRALPLLGLAAAAMLAASVLRGSLQWLLLSSPIVVVLAGVGLARLHVRLRDLLLCAAVLVEFWIGWQAIEPRSAIVERALGQHLRRHLAEGSSVVSNLPRVLLFAGSRPTGFKDDETLLAAASGDGVDYVVLGSVLAQRTTVTAALAKRFSRFELPHDLGDLVANANLAVFVKR